MKRHLLVTTTADSSLECFRPFCDILLLDSDGFLDVNNSIVNYGSVYIRSQFNKPEVMPQRFQQQIDAIGRQARQMGVSVIDNMATVQEIVNFEDKWHQYQLFREYMPETWLATGVNDVEKPIIYKKRISSRATGIAWRREDIMGDENEWICQRMLDIEEELRVYVVRGVVIEGLAVRQSKTADQKVKVVGARKITADEMRFAQAVHQQSPQLDLIGLDIAVTPDGLQLIEVNRSPVFASFTRETSLNLASILYGSRVADND